MNARYLLVIAFALTVSATGLDHRPQKLAAVRAHSILPESLRWVVKAHGDKLFDGIDAGMQVSYRKVTEASIQRETHKITELIDSQAPFSRVVYQMGYVTGLLATWLNPSFRRGAVTQRGFDFYTNAKLKRFLFVFDGYDQLGRHANIEAYLNELAGPMDNYGRLLQVHYTRVGNNERFLFDERSAVFGICSIYFSNLARCSAQLWRHAWYAANGDPTKTPFMSVQRASQQTRHSAR